MNEEIIKEWPQLYAKSSRGVKTWFIRVLRGTLQCGVQEIVYGLLEGKRTKQRKVIERGKNIGKKNETTPVEQAIKEAQSKFDKQIQKGYVENIKDIDKFKPFPMLAKDFKKAKHRIEYPCYVQPKLNGIRCIVIKQNGVVTLTSRNCLEFTTLDHLKPELFTMLAEGERLDGEIYNHDLTFQEIVSYTKKYYKGLTEKLQLHVYDFPYNGDAFDGRYTRYMLFDSSSNKTTQFVKSYLVNTEQEIYDWHDKFVVQGYEGIIIRNSNGLYQWDTRSFDLQKYKEFIDEEFTIIGYWSGTGTDAGAIKFKCRIFSNVTGRNQIFDVRPKGSIKRRREMYKVGWKYIGKLLTVRYQNLSDEGVPVFPVGLEVRDYE